MLNHGNIAEIIAAPGKDDGPNNAAGDVVKNETPVSHASDAGHKGGKGADNRDEAGEENGLAAVLFVEFIGLIKIFPFKKKAFFLIKDAGAEKFSQGVINRITGNRGHGQNEQQQLDLQAAQGGKGTQGKKEGVARQDGCHNQARFTENYYKNNEVCPDTAKLNNHVQVLVEVNEDIDNPSDKIHGQPFPYLTVQVV